MLMKKWKQTGSKKAHTVYFVVKDENKLRVELVVGLSVIFHLEF